MDWKRVSRDIPEGEPLLVSYGDRAVVALAFPADYYCAEMTFMDARTYEILPIPSHWMSLPEAPQEERSHPTAASDSRRAA